MVEAIEVDVSGWEPIQLEARGSGANQWRKDPHGVPWLYKATRRAMQSGQLQGEDWAEKVAERHPGRTRRHPANVGPCSYLLRTTAGPQPEEGAR